MKSFTAMEQAIHGRCHFTLAVLKTTDTRTYSPRDYKKRASVWVRAIVNTAQNPETSVTNDASVQDTLHKWTKGKYKIAVNPGCTYALEYGETRKGYILANVFGIDAQTRNVTHLPTGFKLPGYFRLLRDAKAYAEALYPLTDWLSITAENAPARFTPMKTYITQLMTEHGI